MTALDRRSRVGLHTGAVLCCTALLATAVFMPRARAQSFAATATPIDTPTAAGSSAYALAAGADGKAYLVWIENAADKSHVLRFSRLDGHTWSAPRDIARASNWFVNWADHPSLTALADGTLIAHWLVNTGRKQGAYGYGIHVARSSDQGATWTKTFEDGMRNVTDYAGFLTFAPAGTGADAIYLTPVAPDEANLTNEHAGHDEGAHIKTLAAVSFGADGTVSGQQVVDPDVCSCCMTDIAHTSLGPIAVYRDHLPGEIRDISIVRRVDGRWTAPQQVARDGWQIPGCPTNGPAVAARDRQVSVAWFTAANDTPRLKLARSSDAGATFTAPIVIDDGNPVGWPDVTVLENGDTLVSWLERRGEGIGEVLVRRIAAGRTTPGRPIVVAQSVSGRATGVPHMVRVGDEVIVAWRKDRVMTAAVPVGAIE
ncbi:MAG: exo-alpha-sialidase [Acidobacteria bacterium]|nr:exo-alpha-sialidase [Acidobacteriota bacterium]